MSQPMHASTAANDATRRRQLLLVAALAVVVAAALVVYLLRMGSGGSSSSTALGQPPTNLSPSARVTPAATPSALAVPANYNGPVGHNPFKPLVVPPPPTSAAPSPSPSPTPSLVLPTAVPTVTVFPTPTGLPTAGKLLKLTLIAVNPNTPSVTVAITDVASNTTQTISGIRPGQIFDTYFKLVSVLSSDPSQPPVQYGADFEYGDQFIQLGVGETATVD
ncbi:hypothetical protein Acel_1310 [Acidothermus cellulolyticus 11B]|jgi:hypothetical protein|uniref:Uncharacterized protein n=1 Tax=Acidothermus cellulolyticus (strain ATCC 43068 / DSM 8971 / 11B) TaxID=351607 RepID=A0LUH2_ACIC1|nr:hypothetical protein [Acidothermus cellulolyticus]ABK53082.1 hypothetical protein Acel_1310 [Acidothermus cellulolyticus 11B]